MFKSFFFVYLLLFAEQVAWAKNPTQPFKFRIDSYNGISSANRTGSALNPGNRILELSEASLFTDNRSELKFNLSNKLKMTINPRLQLMAESRTFKSPDEQRRGIYSKLDLTEAYVEASADGDWLITFGLFSFQWGPAEFLSPSNPLFHFKSDGKTYLYQEKGKGLLKLASSLDHWSWQALFEVFDNNERTWVAEREYENKILIKAERRFENSFNYLGLTTGLIEAHRAFIGEYANTVLIEGTSLYLDARHSPGNLGFSPQQNAFGLYDLLPAEDNNQKWSSLVTLGFRQEFTAIDYRLEYIYNELGYSKDQMTQALQAGTLPSLNLLSNLQRLQRSGKELLGRQYLYSSLRVLEIARIRDLTGTLRYLLSLQDNSSNLQLSFDKPLNDSLIGLLEFSATSGADSLEFTLGNRFSFFTGIKWTN